MELTDEEKSLIQNALVEYEENHYESESQDWQKQINKLIERFLKWKKNIVYVRNVKRKFLKGSMKKIKNFVMSVQLNKEMLYWRWNKNDNRRWS